MADKKRRKEVRRGVVKALLSPVNVAAVAIGSAAAAAAGSVALLAAGGATYAAMVAWDLSSKSFWKKLSGQRAALDPSALTDRVTRQLLERILAARTRIAGVLRETPEEVAAHVSSALGGVAELESRAGRLAGHAEQIARHLASTDRTQLRGEAESLAAKARGAQDAEARRHYAEAGAARQAQLTTLTELDAARDRVLASLERILTTLEGVPTQVVKMRTLDAEAVDQFSGDVGEELDRINVEMGAFEETLQTLVEARTVRESA
jgi:hypothetical protein